MFTLITICVCIYLLYLVWPRKENTFMDSPRPTEKPKEEDALKPPLYNKYREEKDYYDYDTKYKYRKNRYKTPPVASTPTETKSSSDGTMIGAAIGYILGSAMNSDHPAANHGSSHSSTPSTTSNDYSGDTGSSSGAGYSSSWDSGSSSSDSGGGFGGD